MSLTIDFVQLKRKLLKSEWVKSVVKQPTGIITITFIDDLSLYLEERTNHYHPFYTYLDTCNPSYFYVDQMPHFSFEEIYAEIHRMANPETRTKLCRSNYFKSY